MDSLDHLPGRVLRHSHFFVTFVELRGEFVFGFIEKSLEPF